MRRIVPSLLIPVAFLSLYAETTGRINGKVTNKEGKPVAGAKVNLKRTDRGWTKDLVTDKNGFYLQVGLDPQTYTLTVTAEGYALYQEKDPVKIPLGDLLTKDITLLTPAEAHTQAIASGVPAAASDDPGAMLDAAGRDAFNRGIPLYNEGKFEEALPHMEQAYKSLRDALAKLKDEQDREKLAKDLPMVERSYGICLAMAGAKKEDAEPYLATALKRNPKDDKVIKALIETSKAKGDKVAEANYSAMLEAIYGPNPDLIYNKGVEAFNAGKSKEAKACWLRALAVASSYPEAHFMLAMVEFGDNNLKGTKHHLLKYIEIAPNGKNAAVAKEMLKDPSLKSVK